MCALYYLGLELLSWPTIPLEGESSGIETISLEQQVANLEDVAILLNIAVIRIILCIEINSIA